MRRHLASAATAVITGVMLFKPKALGRFHYADVRTSDFTRLRELRVLGVLV